MEHTFSDEFIKRLAKAGLPERIDENGLNQAVEQADKIISFVRKKEYNLVLGIGDDFIPDIDLYNALGGIYSLLPRDVQDKALAAFLTQFDPVNYSRVQMNHTRFIREPLVLGDLCVVRRLYWPGLEEASELIKKLRDFSHFEKELISEDGLFNPEKVKSDFCMAYAALRSDISLFGSDYATRCNSKFLDRVINSIVAMRFGRLNNDSDVTKGHKRLRELLPKELHELVDQKYIERKWVNYTKFE